MTARRDLRLTALAAFLALAAGSAAKAQIETHSNAPIDITANEAEVVNSKCLAIWKGAAEALQGDTRLRADTITVYEAPKGKDAGGQTSCGATERVIAEGHVFYVTPDQKARGERAVYTAANDEIVMTGDVIVAQGKDVARGDKLIIKVSTKQFTMVSNATGARAANRVRGVFYPQKAEQPAAGTPVTDGPSAP
jgi:lipopolysaccharide export system protein LptA